MAPLLKNCTSTLQLPAPSNWAVSRVNILVKEDGTYNFQVDMYSKEKGLVSRDDDILKTISAESDYKFCPG